MDECDWNEGDRPHFMLMFLECHGHMSERKLRLFSAACCRRVWPNLVSLESRKAVEVGELVADREQHPTLLKEVQQAAKSAIADSKLPWQISAASAACCLTEPLVKVTPIVVLCNHAAKGSDVGSLAEYRWQASRLRDIFGPLPFHRPDRDAALPAWNNRTVHALAEAAYNERQMPEGTLDKQKLFVLADALEEAGCSDADILEHLRKQYAVHVRGCWVVDLLLGKT